MDCCNTNRNCKQSYVFDIEDIDVCPISETHFTIEPFIPLKGYEPFCTMLRQEMSYKTEQFQGADLNKQNTIQDHCIG